MGFFDKVKKAFNFDDDDEAFEDFEEEETRRAEEAKKEQFRTNSVNLSNLTIISQYRTFWCLKCVSLR